MQDNEAQPREDRNLDQDAPSLGQILKRAREAQGLTLEQICAELRFEQHLLEALENDRLDELGAAVFAKGYIKHYGQRLGLDYAALAKRYHAAVGREDMVIEPSRAIKLRDERQITVWVIAAVALLAIGVVLFLWWINDAGRPVAFPTPAGSTASTARESPPAESTTPTARESPPAGETRRAGAAGAHDAEAPPASAVAPAGAETGPADAANALAPAAADVASRAASADNGAPQPAAGDVRLELVFLQDSWTEVGAADGTRLVYGLMRAGERELVTGRAPLSVLLGNAAGVRVAVDGETFAIPAAARRGDLAEFTVGERED